MLSQDCCMQSPSQPRAHALFPDLASPRSSSSSLSSPTFMAIKSLPCSRAIEAGIIVLISPGRAASGSGHGGLAEGERAF